MPPVDWFILMGMGGLFLILGIALVVWGKREESGYYNSLSTRTDVRKFLERESRPRFESLKVGGWLAITVGLVMIAMGSAFWLWG